MSMSESQIQYHQNKSFNEFLEVSYEVFIICPKCQSDKGHYDNFFSHYRCDKCNYMDHADELDWKYDRRTILGK